MLVFFLYIFFNICILAFSKNLIDHVIYLRVVLEVLLKHQLYAKQFVFLVVLKCNFWATLFLESVKVDISKTVAIQQWPILISVKRLRGFLG